MARLWDLPGAGSHDWPAATYVRDAGLRHFDGVLLVTSGAFTEAEEELLSLGREEESYRNDIHNIYILINKYYVYCIKLCISMKL